MEYTMYIAMLDSRLMTVDGQAVRVTHFPQIAYGHICLEIQLAAALARREGAKLVFLPPLLKINTGLFSLTFEDLAVLDRDAPLARTTRHWWEALERAAASDMRQAALLARQLKTQVVSGRLRITQDQFKRHGGWPYYRRRLLLEPSRARLPDRLIDDLEKTARSLGVADDARLVSLYVREEGWYGSLGRTEEEKRFNRHRCANIATYAPAVAWLVAQGYTVVRMGDASMRPFKRPGCLDLATSPLRTDLLELYLLSRSDFAITGDSGPTHAAMLLDRPVLTVNIACPMMGFPIRPDSMGFLKSVYHRGTGKPLPLAERFGVEYNRYPMDTDRFEVRDNSPEELLAAVREMVAFQHTPSPETPEQQAYAARVSALAEDAQHHVPVFLKWGPDHGFLGAGRMCQTWLEHQQKSFFDDACDAVL
jgi:putative glycosyltransferase (TIGR04372 family)